MVLSSTVLNDLFSKKEYERIHNFFLEETKKSSSGRLDSVSAGKFIRAAAFHFFKNPLKSSTSADLISEHIIQSFRDLDENEVDVAGIIKSFYFIVQDRCLKDKRIDLIELLLPIFQEFLERCSKSKKGNASSCSHSSFAINLYQQFTLSKELKDRALKLSDSFGMSGKSSGHDLLQGWILFWDFYRMHEKFKEKIESVTKKEDLSVQKEESDENINPYADLKISDENVIFDKLMSSFLSFEKGLTRAVSNSNNKEELAKISAWFPFKKLLRALLIISEYFVLFGAIQPTNSALSLVAKLAKDSKLLDFECLSLKNLVRSSESRQLRERMESLLAEFEEDSTVKVHHGYLALGVAWSLHTRKKDVEALEVIVSLLRIPEIHSSSVFYLILAEANYLVCRIQNGIACGSNAQYSGGFKEIREKGPMHFMSESAKFLTYLSTQISKMTRESITDDLGIFLISLKVQCMTTETLFFRYRLFREVFAGLQSRLYIKQRLKKCEEFGFLSRIVESMLHFTDLDLSFDDENEASGKLQAVEYIMSMLSSKNEKTSSRREYRPSTRKLEYHKINEEVGSSPLLTRPSFKIPSWSHGHHCRKTFFMGLTVKFVALRAATYYMSGEIEMSKQFFKGLDAIESQVLSYTDNNLELEHFSYDAYFGNELRFDCLTQERDWSSAANILESQKKRISLISRSDYPQLRTEYAEKFVYLNLRDDQSLECDFRTLQVRDSDISESKTPQRELKCSQSLVNAPVKKIVPVPMTLDIKCDDTKNSVKYLDIPKEVPLARKTRKGPKKCEEVRRIPTRAKTSSISSVSSVKKLGRL